MCVDLGLLADPAGVGDRQPVEQVHQHHHHEEDEDQKEEVAEPWAHLERHLGEFQLPNKHGKGFDQSKTKVVKELWLVIFTSKWSIAVQEDEETEAESDDEQGVPEKEGEEGGEDAEEHGGVDVAAVPGGVAAQHDQQLEP